MSKVMYDSVTVSTIPADPFAVAGYVGGLFPSFSPEVAKFPNAKHLSIAVNAEEDAECLDIEAGDARPDEAPAWVKRQIARGVKRPVVYASLDNMPAVLSALSSTGIKRSQVRVWTAHYTHVAHIEPGSDATQWTDRALNRNLDESLLVDGFFTDPVAPPVENPPHYDWFDKTSRVLHFLKLDEFHTVQRYDRLRKQGKTGPVMKATKLQLSWLEARLVHTAEVVDPNPHTGRPSWGKFHRGWRHLQLDGRAKGVQFVK